MKLLTFKKFQLLLLIFATFIATFIFWQKPAIALQKIIEKNYFASLRASETNVRAGPGQNYPIKFTFKLRSIPVRVISEYDNWNEIEDYESQSGWVSQNLLTKKRTLMVRTQKPIVNMHAKEAAKSRVIFKLENNVIGNYIKCSEDWCLLKINNKKGWVEKSELWGSDLEEMNSDSKI
jgi:SH3-like domain-containing protein